MKIGVSINGVLRNFFGQIEKVHTKYFNPEDGEEVFIGDYNLEDWITFPKEEIVRNEIEFDPNFDEKEFLNSEKEFQLEITQDEEITIEDFLYSKCCLEIFGYADETVDGAVNYINDLSLYVAGKHEFVITSREAGRTVPSTLFFLSKTGCMIQDIKFTIGTTDCWNYVDVMITDHPEILQSKPEGKVTIKIEKTFNKNIPSDHTVKSVMEVGGLELFKH